MDPITFTKKDFRIDWFSGTGGGGQYRNKHQNCCRITHIATGLRAQSTAYRERPANQKAAFNRLAAMLIAHFDTTESERRHVDDVVRTYHMVRGEVIDHASGLRARADDVLNGDLDEMIVGRDAGRPLPKSGRV